MPDEPHSGELLREKPYTINELQLVACPCGYEFDYQEQRHVHFERDHRPEDFGLSPIVTRPVQARLTDGFGVVG